MGREAGDGQLAEPCLKLGGACRPAHSCSRRVPNLLVDPNGVYISSSFFSSFLQVELAEGSCRAWVEVKKRQFQELGTQTAAPADAAASSGTAAAAAAVGPVGEQQQQPSQQQQQQCSADSNAGGAEGGPVTPKQPQQQQQHTSSDQEQEQQQHPSSDQEQQLECDAADERRLLPSEMMQQPHVSPQ